MNKAKLTIIVSCMLLYSGLGAGAAAAEADNPAGGDSEVEEVLVTADKVKDISPVKSTIITEDTIKARGAHNVAEALKDVPGLDITSSNTQGKATAQFRGSDADNTKVYVDGVPLSPVGDNKVDLSAIPADNIAKIEVMKGVAPVIYGADAPGGIIYITTKKASNKSDHSLAIATGSHHYESLFASVAGRQDRISYIVDAKKDHTHGYTFHSRIKSDYYNGKLTWDFDPSSSLTVFDTYSRQREQLPNRINPASGLIDTNPGEGGSIQSGAVWGGTYNWEYEPRKNTYLGAVYNKKLSSRSDLSFELYQSKEDSHLRGLGSEMAPVNDQYIHQYWDGKVKGYELQDTIRLNRANTATLGYNYETKDFCERTVHSRFKNWNKFTVTDVTDYDYTGKSCYVQDVITNRKLAVNIGYRHDQNKDSMGGGTIATAHGDILSTDGDKSFNSPVVSFKYALTGATALHGAFGKSHRWPNAKERCSPGGIYGWYGGSYIDPSGKYWCVWPDGSLHQPVLCTNVLPEDVINREIGLAHTFRSGLKCDFTYYSKNISNMIKGQALDSGQITNYYNIPNVQMHGYEGELSYKLGKQVTAFLNYTYTNAYDTLMLQRVTDIPLRKFSWGFNYAGKDGLNANLLICYVGSVRSEFSNGSGNGSGDTTNMLFRSLSCQDLPHYHVVDLKVSKSTNDEEYYVKVSNLLDKKYNAGAWLVAPGRYVEMGTSFKF